MIQNPNDMAGEEIQEFIAEATDLLDSAETDLLALDKGGNFKSHYDSVFRVFHSLKGGAGMLGLSDLQSHMHKVETILSGCKKVDAISKSEISLFLRSVDAARKLLAGQKISFDYSTEPTANTTPSSPAPAASTSSPTVQKPAPLKAPSKEKKCLAYIVDDEPDILDILQTILESASFEVRAFSDPRELIQEVSKKSPDVVFTDMKMPILSGLEVLKGVKALDPDCPVIFLSGYLTKDILIEALSAGIHAAIEKPFQENTVVNYALSATKQSRTLKLLNRTINLIMYQFTDLEKFLTTSGKEDIRNTIRNELNTLITQRRELRSPTK